MATHLTHATVHSTHMGTRTQTLQPDMCKLMWRASVIVIFSTHLPNGILNRRGPRRQPHDISISSPASDYALLELPPICASTCTAPSPISVSS
eukprot:10049343-Alexandrium_andersonii.AAC.1